MTRSLQLGDFNVLRMGLGTNRIKNSPDAHHLLQLACDLGVNFYDTANIYQDGESELSIAAALSPYPKHVCIATKGGFKKHGPDSYEPEGHPIKLRKNLEDSLVRLRVNQIDLYQLHRVDPLVPLADSVGVLKDLQSEGKIRYIGLSEVSISQIEQAQTIIKVMAVQNRYNLFERCHEKVVDFCHKKEIIFMPFFPLGSSRHLFPAPLMQVLSSISKKYNCTPYTIALAWLLHRSPYMLPIPGTLSKQHLLENISALSIPLSTHDLENLSMWEKVI